MYHILIKDDYTIYRKGISAIIKSCFPYSQITEADSTRSLAYKARHQKWDLIILDIAEASAENFALLSTLKNNLPETRLIITTEVENPLLTKALIAAGASACLTKDCSIENFVKAVDHTAVGKIQLNYN